jgi:hypothetical protein
MIQFGNDKIKEIYHGSDKIKEVYHGSELVYTAHDPRGYWVHKDTGVITYFGLDDPSIEDGIMGYPSWMPNCSEVKLPSGVTGFKTYNWVFEEFDNEEITYTGFVHSKETLLTGNEVLVVVDLSNTDVPSLGDNLFAYCISLASITLPESIVSLGGGCFATCLSLASITLPESIVSLGEGCFAECSSLTSITLPESVTSLGDFCFAWCLSLASITLPESIVSLGEYCFAYCTSLTSITLPESITSLGEGCFMFCSSLTLATVLPAIPPTLGTNAFNNVHPSFNIKVRSPYVDAYKAATNWTAYASIISAI